MKFFENSRFRLTMGQSFATLKGEKSSRWENFAVGINREILRISRGFKFAVATKPFFREDLFSRMGYKQIFLTGFMTTKYGQPHHKNIFNCLISRLRNKSFSGGDLISRLR